MRPLIMMVFVLVTYNGLAQQVRDTIKPPQQKAPERKTMGAGKPTLFAKSSSGKKLQANSAAPKISLDNIFRQSAIGDTLTFPFSGGKLEALIITNTRRGDALHMMNLKVVNYDNAMMRLVRSVVDNKVVYRGMVHHPGYSDALIMKSDNGNAWFEPVNQSDIINE